MLDINAKTGRRRVKKGCEVEFTVLEVSDWLENELLFRSKLINFEIDPYGEVCGF